MQKTEKHCKNQCFYYHKTTKISPKTGPKTQKSASGPGHLRNRKKRCCKPKNWSQKVEKHGFFSLFACRFWTGAFTNRCLPYCFFYSVFWRRASRPIKKQEVLAEKCPPPGKPVTFYECHPEDHAPAPSVRADLWWFGGWFTIVLTTLLCFRIFCHVCLQGVRGRRVGVCRRGQVYQVYQQDHGLGKDHRTRIKICAIPLNSFGRINRVPWL